MYFFSLPIQEEKALKTIPKEIRKLTLSKLNLEYNSLLINISSFYLSNNSLTTIPKEIENLVNIVLINPEKNSLAILPEELTNLTLKDILF